VDNAAFWSSRKILMKGTKFLVSVSTPNFEEVSVSTISLQRSLEACFRMLNGNKRTAGDDLLCQYSEPCVWAARLRLSARPEKGTVYCTYSNLHHGNRFESKLDLAAKYRLAFIKYFNCIDCIHAPLANYSNSADRQFHIDQQITSFQERRCPTADWWNYDRNFPEH